MNSNSKPQQNPPKSARRKRRPRQETPFDIPESTNVYKAEDQTNEEPSSRALSLKDRALLNSAPSSNRSIRKQFDGMMQKDTEIKEGEVKPVSEIRQRQQQSAHLIQEQREIFLSNLLISRHQRELERLNMIKQAKEAKLEEQSLEISEVQKISKSTSNQMEGLRARQKQKLEEQTRHRIEVEGQVKQKRQSMVLMDTEIKKLEDLMQTYSGYQKFLSDIEKHYGKWPSNSSELLAVFDKMEGESLFLMQNAERVGELKDQSESETADEIASLTEENQRLDEQIAKVEAQMKVLERPGQQQALMSRDSDFAEIQKEISDVFHRCYSSSESSQNSLTMLGIIEADFNSMIKRLNDVDPACAAKRLKVLHNEKRKEQREANQAAKLKEQIMKNKQMMARAQMPVKQKTGRPLTVRVIPTKARKKDSAKLEKEQIERERIEAMLYGPVFD